MPDKKAANKKQDAENLERVIRHGGTFVGSGVFDALRAELTFPKKSKGK